MTALITPFTFSVHFPYTAIPARTNTSNVSFPFSVFPLKILIHSGCLLLVWNEPAAHPLLKIDHSLIFYETIDNGNYSKHTFYSLNNSQLIISCMTWALFECFYMYIYFWFLTCSDLKDRSESE